MSCAADGKPDKNAVSRIYGCFVNNNREIVADLDEFLGMMPQEGAEKYLDLLKKTRSGTLGKNLIDIVFSTQQAVDGEEHKLLMELCTSEMRDNQIRQTFYQKVIQSLDMGESSDLLLLANDSYDVPHRSQADLLQPIPPEALPVFHETPVFSSRYGWVMVDAIAGELLLAGGVRLPFADAAEVYALPPAFAISGMATDIPLRKNDIARYDTVWVEPTSMDTALRNELCG